MREHVAYNKAPFAASPLSGQTIAAPLIQFYKHYNSPFNATATHICVRKPRAWYELQITG